MSETKQIIDLIPKIAREIGVIGKDRQAGTGQWGYAFRGIDDVVNVLGPLLHKHGVFFTPEVLDIKANDVVLRKNDKDQLQCVRVVTVRYTFYAPDGSSVSCVTTGEGIDNGDKASNKALSGALKYALLQTFAIPTVDLYVDQETSNTERTIADELADPEKFIVLLAEAFDAKEFSDQDRDAVKVKVCKIKKVSQLKQLNLQDRHAMLDTVVKGGFDNMRKQVLAGAGA